jgi:predicted aconitase with swiveling domain
MIRTAKAYAPGEAEGLALVLVQELSFWGGVEVETGNIIDHSHPDLGENVAGRILVMPSGRGSSSSSSVLAEAIRLGTGPLGIVLARPDPILTVASLVAQSLYGVRCPVVVCAIDGFATGNRLRISAAETGAARVEVLAPPVRDQGM